MKFDDPVRYVFGNRGCLLPIFQRTSIRWKRMWSAHLALSLVIVVSNAGITLCGLVSTVESNPVIMGILCRIRTSNPVRKRKDLVDETFFSLRYTYCSDRIAKAS